MMCGLDSQRTILLIAPPFSIRSRILALNLVYNKFHHYSSFIASILQRSIYFSYQPTNLVVFKLMDLGLHRISKHSKVLMKCQAL